MNWQRPLLTIKTYFSYFHILSMIQCMVAFCAIKRTDMQYSHVHCNQHAFPNCSKCINPRQSSTPRSLVRGNAKFGLFLNCLFVLACLCPRQAYSDNMYIKLIQICNFLFPQNCNISPEEVQATKLFGHTREPAALYCWATY